MRSATLVLVAYALMLVAGVVWPALPLPVVGDAPPAFYAVTAGYLGLTARHGAAGPVAAAVVTGYLADLLSGTAHGLFALTGGLVCVAAHGVQRQILVRGWALTAGFALAVTVLATLVALILRATLGGALAGLGTELWALARVGLTTVVLGPAVIRLYRRIDAAFARTHRERDHALEGLAP